MKVKAIFLFAGATMLAGCQTAQMNTASGGPEVTIRGVSPDKVKPIIVGSMLDTKFRIKTDTQYSLVFEKNDENAARVVLFGTGYGPPVDRVTFTIAEVPGGTRVVADSANIANAGTAYERKSGFAPDFPPDRMQQILNEIAASTAIATPSSTVPMSSRHANR